jgi:hypothetical protein
MQSSQRACSSPSPSANRCQPATAGSSVWLAQLAHVHMSPTALEHQGLQQEQDQGPNHNRREGATHEVGLMHAAQVPRLFAVATFSCKHGETSLTA